MLRFNLVVASGIAIITALMISASALAIDSPILISQIKLGDELSAKNEFIEIYNNTDRDVEITNWCLFYQSLSLTERKLGCFNPASEISHIFLPSKLTAMALSNEQVVANPLFGGDLFFAATLSGTGGYVYLSDGAMAEIDKVGWNSDVSSGNFALTPTPGKLISRKLIMDSSLLQDTDVNIDDFENTYPRETYTFGDIYEVYDLCKNLDGIQELVPENYYSDNLGDCYEIIDFCPNIDDWQLIVPDGYELDENGNCQIDVCLNLDSLQLVIPEDMIMQDNNCVYYDFCPNLEDIQKQLPAGYHLNDLGNCMLDVVQLYLSELLPNVDGVDDGKEFIEIHNPNDFEVNLSNYILKFDDLSEKYFQFSDELVIEPLGYYAIYNSSMDFSMRNTIGGVWLLMRDDQFIDYANYINPEEDESWTLIDKVWQYTNRVTPGDANLNYFNETKPPSDESLVPCGPNQYRNPETNRCKNIIETTSILTPCKVGQYRSEETNRCRNIASDVVNLIPCDEGEERNPETNRCRKVSTIQILGLSTLGPCSEGEERNPETNRCRKVVTEIPQASYEVEPVDSSQNNNVLWWSIGAVGFLSICYAIWEWRQEITRLFNKIMNFTDRKK